MDSAAALALCMVLAALAYVVWQQGATLAPPGATLAPPVGLAVVGPAAVPVATGMSAGAITGLVAGAVALVALGAYAGYRRGARAPLVSMAARKVAIDNFMAGARAASMEVEAKGLIAARNLLARVDAPSSREKLFDMAVTGLLYRGFNEGDVQTLLAEATELEAGRVY
jgi:hypothetical protein